MNPNVRIAVASGVVAGLAAATAVGARLWRRSTTCAVARLRSTSTPSQAEVFSAEQLHGLPDPVRRYFEFALVPGQPRVVNARVEQAGTFRIGNAGAPWKPFIAVQHYSTYPPGFVWDARIRMAPVVSVRVRDSYLDGAGAMQAQIASLVPILNERSRPELDGGALLRYLAEAVWFPTALLPGQGVEWKAIDGSAALATLTDGRSSVALEFRFGPRGEIVGAYAPARSRAVDHGYVPTPWECFYRSYEPLSGMMIPREAEAAWLLPEGRLPYFRGFVPAIEYGVA